MPIYRVIKRHPVLDIRVGEVISLEGGMTDQLIKSGYIVPVEESREEEQDV